LSEIEFHVGDDWAEVVAQLLTDAAARDRQIALTGGTTPGKAYERAAELRPDWSGATVWWSDERCVEPDNDRSNYKVAHDSLLSRLETLPTVHRIRGELQRDAAAEEYERELGDTAIDVMLLGIGPDGHVASLFPNAATLDERERKVVGADAGFEPYVDRVTFTLPALRSAAFVVFLVTGAGKAEAVGRAFAEEPTRAVPASLVRGRERTLAVLDAAAAARLP
jgi:6-phosphogluconolactonase